MLALHEQVQLLIQLTHLPQLVLFIPLDIETDDSKIDIALFNRETTSHRAVAFDADETILRVFESLPDYPFNNVDRIFPFFSHTLQLPVDALHHVCYLLI